MMPRPPELDTPPAPKVDPKQTRSLVAMSSLITSDLATSLQKNKRKTFGFGKYTKKDKTWEGIEIHIRELSLSEAGLGCALWDASIILSRSLFAQRELLKGTKILEVGAGCGLPAIVAGLFANEVVGTDYIEKAVENLQYNINVNAQAEDDDVDSNEQESRQALRKNLASSTRAAMLDWDIDDEANVSLFGRNSFDIIMGTELVYTPNDHHHQSLKNVICRYLKPNGVVWFCQSDNRLDMPVFLELMKSHEFEVSFCPVPEHLLGQYQSRQVLETYKFYTFRRKCDAKQLPDLTGL